MSLENLMVDGMKQSVIIDMGMCLRVPYTREDGNGVADVTAGTLRFLINPDIPCGKVPYMSPEILKSQQPFDGFGIDLWGAGVILFMMLTGMPPFQIANADDARYRQISRGGLEQLLRGWGRRLSHSAIDLLQNMLLEDPRQRLTFGEIKDHPWVLDEVPSVGIEPPTPMEGWRY